ncbi:MAG: hypothetical protein HOK49_12695 [Opitutae bacterium]|jgi:general secretion pathway protein D|nr:hypothetical protein [Opitutae bacterium]
MNRLPIPAILRNGIFGACLALAGLTHGLWAQPVVPPPAEPTIVELIPLALVDSETHEVIKLLEELTGKLSIRAQNLPNVKLNFNAEGNGQEITLDEAILVIESLLSLNGITITGLGDNEKFFRVLPAAGVNAQVPDFIQPEKVEELPASQKIYSTYFKLDYLTVEQALPKIQPFLTPGVGTTVIFEKSNSFLCTDALLNLQRVRTLLDDIDQPADFVELKFFNMEHMDASEMKQRFDGLAQGPLKKYLEGNTVIEADERTNQLMVLTHRSNLPILEKIISQLDVNVEPRTKSKVFKVMHAQAKEVEALINQVISNQQSVRNQASRKSGSSIRSGNSPTKPTTTAAKPATPKPTSVSASSKLSDKNLQFSDFVIIVADERSNAIVASGTQSDIDYIGDLIEQIDVLLPQVRIEAIIAEVSLTKNMKRGIEAFKTNFNINQTLGEGQTTNNSSENFTFDLMTGALSGISGRYSLDFVWQAAKSSSNVRVLSSPAILTTHNQEAVINVSESRPIITSTQSSSYTAGYASSQVQYRDIGIQLKVKPLIGQNGVIQMEIEQKIEDVGEMVSVNENEQPVIMKREANSFVSVGDQEVIIMGGLQSLRTSDTDNRSGPFGQIPIIGALLGSRAKEGNVKELIIFIKPHVVNTVDAASKLAQDRIEKLHHGKDIKQFTENGAFNTLKALTDEEKKASARIRDWLGLQKNQF